MIAEGIPQGKSSWYPSRRMLDYKWLVQDDRIHASLYTDPTIFADELERVFHRGWVFVGTARSPRRSCAGSSRTSKCRPRITVS